MNFDTDGYSHYDRRETLDVLLSSAPVAVHTKTLAEVLSWGEVQRAEFNRHRLDRLIRGITLGTPQIETLRKLVSQAMLFRNSNGGRPGVLLSGSATMGKTTAAIQAMRFAHEQHEREHPEWRDLDHIPVVYIEVPPGSTGKGIMGRILEFLGVTFTARMTYEERKSIVVAHLARARTRLIVIDEMHNLSRLNNGNFESAQAIKDLNDAVRATPLYVGIDLDRSIITNGALGNQFAGRSTSLNLRPCGYASDEDRLQWRRVVGGFEDELGLLNHPKRALDKHEQYLWSRTRGSISALSRLLTIATCELILNDDPAAETITLKQLEHIQLDTATERSFEELTATEQAAARAARKQAKAGAVHAA